MITFVIFASGLKYIGVGTTALGWTLCAVLLASAIIWCQGGRMQMSEPLASAVAVSVPIFALAAGAEARGIRDRLRRPDQQWEREFAAYRAEHELDLDGQPASVLGFLKDMPALSKAYAVERVIAIASTAAWLVVFVLLGITELRCLVWLGDGGPAGSSSLATFSLVTIVIAMAALIVAPALYLLVPVALPLDVLPHGLKRALAPGVGTDRGRAFFRTVLTELEGALERADEKIEQAGESGRAEGRAAAADHAPPPDPSGAREGAAPR